MEARRHEFKLGKLVVLGSKFDFHPEANMKLEARVGDAASFYVQYGYREASRDKETLDLKFTVAIDGKELGTKTAKVEDTRIATDEQWGLLKHETPLSKKGNLKGTYTLEGSYAKGAWSGKGPAAVTPFKKSGSFSLAVYPTSTKTD